MKYQFMETHREEFNVVRMFRALQVSKNGYYDWRKRGASQREQADRALRQRIQQVHEASRGTYGSPRIWAELRDQGICCGRKWIVRLIRLQGCVPKGEVATVAKPGIPILCMSAENVLNPVFHADAPNQKWVADISYICTEEG